VEEPIEVASAPVIDAIPVSENADSAVAAVPAPSSAPSAPATPVAVAIAQPTEELVSPSTNPEVDSDAVRRAQERYDRAVRTRLAQLGDAPRRILQGAGEAGPFEVEFIAIVDERGLIIELRLVRSSGLPELDEFAEISVNRLRRLARIPSELGEGGRHVPISLVYEA
jgi:outer membrane biosynthesis protein TonB